MAERTYSTADVARRHAISYRIVDNWIRTGVIKPSMPATGSGSQRRFSLDDMEAIDRVVEVWREANKLAAELRTGETFRNALAAEAFKQRHEVAALASAGIEP